MQENNFLKLRGLKRRLMLIIKNSARGVMTPKHIQKIILQSFNNGTCDRPYAYNRICIELRELNFLGLLNKRESSKGNWGRSVYYLITEKGLEVMKENNLISSGVENVAVQ